MDLSDPESPSTATIFIGEFDLVCVCVFLFFSSTVGLASFHKCVLREGKACFSGDTLDVTLLLCGALSHNHYSRKRLNSSRIKKTRCLLKVYKYTTSFIQMYKLIKH